MTAADPITRNLALPELATDRRDFLKLVGGQQIWLIVMFGSLVFCHFSSLLLERARWMNRAPLWCYFRSPASL